MDMKHALLLVCLITISKMEELDWMNHCNKCKCIWSGGKKTADCSNLTLSDIPNDLSHEIREVDFSNNLIFRLESTVFEKTGFKNIHKIKLHNCHIEYIAKSAFFGVPLIIELDLSKNSIVNLDKELFSDNKKLRILNLSDNKIKVLPDGLFYNMTHLQRIYLNNNEIEAIGDKTFVLLSVLQHLDLANNQIKKLTSDITLVFPRLISLNVDGNPWICDCHLQAFRNKTLKKQLITSEPECAEPEYMRGKRWKDSEPFACIPQIIETLPSTEIEASTSNVTLVCKVSGDPEPDVNWVTNGRIVDKDPRQTVQKFVTSKRKYGDYTWNNLTIINVNYRDKGDYKCVAKNPGGVDEKNISLLVPGYGLTGGGFSHPLGTPIALIIVLSCGAVILLMLILFLICCCYKKNNRRMNPKRRDMNQSSEECMTLHGPMEMEKALITDVNPILKPPRASMPNSVNSGGTEVSETKRNLLDNESIITADDESRSLDFDSSQPYRKLSSTYLDPEYRTHLPPDLLSFPPRSQISPAGSSASTVADTTRLPPHHGPQSPLHSPVYDQLNIYRTLPYSRSQSPFRGVSPRVPRQGYVTIPRRPRQSWSCEPPTLSDIGEPLYDNLGLRTTADGSSVLSLNKVGSEAGTPKSASGRMFPVLSPTICDPISELEPQTLPRNHQQQLSPSRMDWAKANAEALRSPERRNSSPEKKISKIPPRPPPKPPKKRVSTGPLFEDEGEDGTEV